MWLVLSPVLCGTALLLALCAAFERGGEARRKKNARPLLLGCAAASLLSAVLIVCGTHFLYVPAAFSGVCLFLAVRDFLACVRVPEGGCCRFYLAGLAAQTLGGAALLVRRATFTVLGVAFDHNSVFHAYTLVTILFFWRGVRARQKQTA